MNHIIFDTMAILIRMAKNYNIESVDKAPLVPEEDEALVKKARSIFNIDDKNVELSKTKDDIIDICTKENDYFFICAMLCELDHKVDIDKVISQYNFSSTEYYRGQIKSFESLNCNTDDTEIIILPRVKVPKACSKYPDKKGEIKERDNAHSIEQDLNSKLKRIYFVDKLELKKYGVSKINNVIANAPPSLVGEKKFLRIGVSPICNIPMNDLFKIDYYNGKTSNGKHNTQLFGINKLLFPDEIVSRVINSYNKACAVGCDIYMAPEMLGLPCLVETENGCNPIYKPKQEYEFSAPFLTLAPTQWDGKKNVLTIFNEQGRIIGTQHKQNPFTLKEEHRSSQEDLSASNKEILIVHINGWGRFMFPICIDYLTHSYRNLMTSVLKATVLLCPSYSPGEYNFDISINAESEFEVRSLWINSCSATTKHPQDYIGLVSLPTSSNNSQRQRLMPECNASCPKTCLFTVDIPIDNSRQDLGATIKHIHE